jgi:DNA-directed RNA polymerase subunit L
MAAASAPAVNMNPFQNYRESGLKGEWTLSPSNYAYANTLRRIIMSRVPVVAFRADMTSAGTTTDVEILENTTPMTNEMLAHRISLLPIHIDDPDKWAVEGSAYEFVCNVSHNEPKTRDVTTEDIQVFRVADDKTRTPVDAGQFFKGFNYNGRIWYNLIATLKPQMKGSQGKPEALSFKARATVGYGVEHARFIPTSRCTYSYTLDTEPTHIDEVFYTWAQKHKKLDRAALEADTAKKDKLFKEFNTMEIQRCYLKDKDDEPYSFDFVVESVGVYSPTKIVALALRSGERMCRDYLPTAGGGMPKEVIIQPADAELFAFDFIFDGEDHTIGHLLQTWIDINLMDRGEVSYVAYDPMHPLKEMLVLRIGVVDNKEETAVKVFHTALEGCASMFQAWSSYWTEATGGTAVAAPTTATKKRTIRIPVKKE